MTRRPLVAVLALPLVLALAACGGGGTPPDPAPVDEDPGVPVAEEAYVLPDDAVLRTDVEVTADNGATMDVAMVVFVSTAWDDPAAADRPATMTEQCLDALDASIYADQLFSFAKIEVTTVTSGDWPSDAGVFLFPSVEHLSVAATGDIEEAPGFSSEAPHCKRDHQITVGGSGEMIVAFRGDTDDVAAAGGFTRWANHNYGFSVVGPVTFSECTHTASPLGVEFGWSDTYDAVVESEVCRVGIFTEDDDS